MPKPTIDQAIARLSAWCQADPPTYGHHLDIDFMPGIETPMRSESKNTWRCVAHVSHDYVYAYGVSLYDVLCKCCEQLEQR